MIKNRIFALSFRIAAFVLCLAGILSVTGVFKGRFHGGALLYYTLQSNILVLFMFGLLIFETAKSLKKEGRIGSNAHCPRLSVMVLLAIMVTLLVYWALLAPTYKDKSLLLEFSNLSVHLITPILMLADYILFSAGGKLTRRDPLLSCVIPIAYFIQATILGFSGVMYSSSSSDKASHFPYFFIDYYESGWWVALYVTIITAFFIGVSYFMLWVDKKRSSKS
jgi:hypothetical protein